MKKIITLIVMLCLLVIPAHAVDNLTIPNTFNPGETISSSQMNENFSRLIELVDNQSKTINNLESIINALISEFFTQHPRYVTLDYTNGDIGNCATNGLSYPNEVQCTDAVANNTLIDEMDDSQYNPSVPSHK